LQIRKSTPKQEVLRIAASELKEGCKGCWHCCKYGSGYFLDGDINRISKLFGISSQDFKKGYLEETEVFNTKIFRGKMIRKNLPHGKCVLLDHKGKCTIHDIKPLHCRIGTCRKHGEQISIWFALNYLVNETDPESVRQWAQYLKTHPNIQGGKLEDLVPDKDKLQKIMDYEILG